MKTKIVETGIERRIIYFRVLDMPLDWEMSGDFLFWRLEMVEVRPMEVESFTAKLIFQNCYRIISKPLFLTGQMMKFPSLNGVKSSAAINQF